ncbi:MAG TPA: hypothetical protein VFB90_06090 [Dehalococcoidia bacterium]|nr:hypothetical protein [Dehalococcoidia bacterium]
MTAYMETARGQRLLGRLALLALLLAVLPNVLYIGHLPLPGAPVEHIHTPAEAAQHANHCHLGPSSCGDQPSLSGTWWAGEEPAPLTPFSDTLPIASSGGQLKPEAPSDILTPPPRSV